MMRSLIVQLTLLVFSLSAVVEAHMLVRILLNQGNTLESEQMCDSADVEVLEAAIAAASQPSRRGLQVAKKQIPIARKLPVPFFPSSCKRNCQGFAHGHCLVANCIGYRARGRGLLRQVVSHNRQLDWSSDCISQMTDLNDALDSTMSNLSSDCQALVNAPRYMSCITNAGCYYDTFQPVSAGMNDSGTIDPILN
jgi:hypothetical protein